jgi:hypothetical protein
MLWNPVSMRLQRHRQVRGWLRDVWPQGRVETAVVVMLYPRFQDTPQMVFGQRNHKVQTFPPQRAQKPLALVARGARQSVANAI